MVRRRWVPVLFAGLLLLSACSKSSGPTPPPTPTPIGGNPKGAGANRPTGGGGGIAMQGCSSTWFEELVDGFARRYNPCPDAPASGSALDAQTGPSR